MKIATDFYDVELENSQGVTVKVNNVYTTKGFMDAGDIALKYVNSVNNENGKVIKITRILRDATLIECMEPELCKKCMLGVKDEGV